MTIPIYKAETELADKITASCVFAYTMPVEPGTFELEEVAKTALANQFGVAGMRDQDLYYTRSILVTSNWNKNDDVFDRAELLRAKDTPTHKPTNIEHDERQLVGHITDNWLMDTEGNILPDNIVVDDLPEVFHIANGAVVYLNWQDQELTDRTKALIKQIESGEKFVSMECMFSNFDYAVITPDQQYHVVARDESTAWMTKHLRAYGGTGEYQGNKIGRLLRNITFCGKGYVDNPANPGSIIFNSTQIFDFKSASQENPFISNGGVLLNTETLNASESDTENSNQEEEKSDMANEEKIQALEATIKELRDELAQSNVAKVEAERDELKARIDELESDVSARDATIEGLQNDLTSANEAKDTAEASCEELKEKVQAIEAEKLRANRIATLVDGGIDKEAAEAKVDRFANLDDEQFEDLAGELIQATKAQVKEETTEAEEQDSEEEVVDEEAQDDAEANADETTLDEAEAEEEPNLSAEAEETDELAETRKELATALARRMGHDLEDQEEEN